MRQPRMNYILVAMIVGIFYYFIYRILRIFNLHLSRPIILLIAVILSLIILFTIIYHGNSKFLDIIGTFSSRIFVLCFLIALVLFCEQIIGIRYEINPRIIVGFIVIVLGIGAYFSLKTKVITYEINTDKIHKDMKILLVSDIHVDHIYKSYHIKKIKKLLQSEDIDFVIIAGDMMNKANEDYPKYFNILHEQETPIFAIMGNHDVMGDKEIINKIPKESSITLLKNENTDTNGIQIIGLTDRSIRGKTKLEENLKECNIRPNSNEFTILITHQPISLEKIKDYPIDLEVAGHTHHGQIFGLRKLTEIVNDYGYGKYEENGKIAIITQGIGTRGLPFRLGTQSEMVIINLKKKN